MKKFKITSVLIFVLIATIAFTGCINRDRYEPLPPQPQPPVGYQYEFIEEFNDDVLGWAFDDPVDSAYALVTNGEYKFVDYSLAGGLHTAVVSTGAYIDNDFLVQTRLESNYAMALIIGASNNHFGFSFFIDNGGNFALYNEGGANESFQTIINWTYNAAINTEGYNDVEFEQVGSYWYGYINGTKVFETPAQYLAGDEFGFMVLEYTIGYADYLRVKSY